MPNHSSDVPGTAGSTGTPDAVLEPLLRALEEFERCLETERGALIDGEAARLFAAVEQKRSALRVIEALMREPQLRALFGRSAARADARADALFGTGADDARRDRLIASPMGARLIEQLMRCRNLNQAAGGAIAASRRSTHQLLHLLGRTPETGTYGVDGTAPAETGGRDLAVC